jgi:uncharacterized protein
MPICAPRFQLALRVGAALAVMLALGGTVRWLALDYERSKSAGGSPSLAAIGELDWQTLVPKGWDPLQRYRNLPLASLDDGSPKAMELARQMRETWDNAPTNHALNGAQVRIAGYVVPLDARKGEMREFLLVPYFGACIHTPPPPANQIIHVTVAQPVKDLRTMDAVSVAGILHTARNDSLMGTSGYTLAATQVERRQPKPW